MVFSQPLCPLLLAGHDQGFYWPLCWSRRVYSQSLFSHGVRIDLLLRAVTIHHVAFRVSLSSLFFPGLALEFRMTGILHCGYGL